MRRSYVACLVLCLTCGFTLPTLAEEPVAPAASADDAARPELAPTVEAAAGTDQAATPAVAGKAETTAPDANAAAIARKAAATSNVQDDDPIVCKRVEATGTRLGGGRLCKPKSFWRQHEKRAEEIMDGLQRASAAGLDGADDPREP